VEEFCVLVPFEGVADFCPSSPVEGPFSDRELESVNGESPQVVFKDGERPPLLQEVKKVDEDTTVCFSLG
jgi:hypothetical protein